MSIQMVAQKGQVRIVTEFLHKYTNCTWICKITQTARQKQQTPSRNATSSWWWMDKTPKEAYTYICWKFTFWDSQV